MSRTRFFSFCLASVLLAGALQAAEWSQQLASLGDFRLENGEVIRDCRIGYRTAGRLNEDRSNVIVLTTWFAGRSEDLAGWVGEGKLFDPARYHIVAIDAFGDGVSSSPSNSVAQPGAAFPRFTIRDMVRSQHEVLTRELKLTNVLAVAGLSMGGMQALQWAASYPSFMRGVVSVVGTPRQTASDLMLWRTELEMLESFSDTPENLRKAMRVAAAIQAMEIRTPAWIVANVTDVTAHLETHRKSLTTRDPFDYMSQLRAMIAHDVGSDDAFAKILRAKLMVVVALQDEMVNPGPARALARATGADIVTLTSDCGHLATTCEREVFEREVRRFLAAL